ncbi:MAG: 50S ribosomal protein L4 [Lachnospiraceae bacterium]|nr:50S ribosomal protein L4 [Lachnospiraceae bacterium]
MANVSVYNMDGQQVGSIDLNDAVFGVEVNEHLLHKARVTTLANSRQGTKKQKTRSEVRGGGKKPWRQKGTGNARQGSIRAPQWKGGGVVFAAVPRDFTLEMNKKEKRAALKSALTNCVKDNNLVVLDELKLNEIKTKNFKKVLDNLKLDKSLVVLEGLDKNVVLSARNIEEVKTSTVNELNVYDVLKYEKVLITKNAVKNIEEVYK